MENKLHILLDSDGVLANFVDGALEAHGRSSDGHDSIIQWDIADLWGITDEEFWKPLRGRDFWYNLKPYPWAKEMVTKIKERGLEMTIATSPSSDTECTGAKLEWLHDNLGIKMKDVMVGSKKWLMAKGNMLIDDSNANCDKFINNGGSALVFPQPWNNGIGDWEFIIELASK